MKIVIAPDSFKGCLRAQEVAVALCTGMRRVLPHAEYVLMPVADGGEGSLEVLLRSTKGRRHYREVNSPLGRRVRACFALSGDRTTAVIEMAQASGLSLIPNNARSPLVASSYGTGQLILAALDKGVSRIIITVGGSATVDAGAGMLQALGIKLLDASGQVCAAGIGGGGLAEIKRIDASELDGRLHSCQISVAADVENPLLGRSGAAAVYAPQKGASAKDVVVLQRNLRHFSRLLSREFGGHLGRLKRGGAGGGLAAGLAAVTCCELLEGAELILDSVEFSKVVSTTDLVVTGEGQIDGQSVYGKAPVAVAKIAAKHQVPVVAVGGALGPGARKVFDHGINALEASVVRPSSLNGAINEAAKNLRDTGERIARWIELAKALGGTNVS